MSLFPYNELKYYFFGLRAGISNLIANGFRLGARKTVGKITQPINSYTRFPEYYLFETPIRNYLSALSAGQPLKILDVGSPKLLGLYLGYTFDADVHLTDISELNLDEYRLMWQSLVPRAKGKASFSLQDARSLKFGDGEFDVVYSMSVIEHIDGDAGDSGAIQEFLRVLKPGGLLLVSVPFGAHYLEQKIIGVSGASRRTSDAQAYFFQRIYDQPAFENRILKFAHHLAEPALTTVWRKYPWVSHRLGAVGENVRGILGFLNPVFSSVVNRSGAGLQSAFAANYGELHSSRDVYGDVVLAGRKLSDQL